MAKELQPGVVTGIPDNFDYTRPSVWVGMRSDGKYARVRFLHPINDPTYAYFNNEEDLRHENHLTYKFSNSCWLWRFKDGQAMKIIGYENQLQAMFEFDEERGMETLFLGYL